MHPVHTFVALDQCPRCHYWYKEVSEPFCHVCDPRPEAEEVLNWRQRAAVRIAAEMAAGEAGSLAGLGFEPTFPPNGMRH